MTDCSVTAICTALPIGQCIVELNDSYIVNQVGNNQLVFQIAEGSDTCTPLTKAYSFNLGQCMRVNSSSLTLKLSERKIVYGAVYPNSTTCTGQVATNPFPLDFCITSQGFSQQFTIQGNNITASQYFTNTCSGGIFFEEPLFQPHSAF